MGTGDREFSMYADSIEAHLAKLQNRISEFATLTIDSSWLKDIVDLATLAMKGINGLAESVNGLNLVLGTAAGLFM